MQGLASRVILILPIIIGVRYLYIQQADQKDRELIEQQLEEAKERFTVQVQKLVGTSDKLFHAGIQDAVASYHSSLSKIYEARKEWWDIEAHRKSADQHLAAGKLSEAQHKNIREAYAVVRQAYDRLLAGDWQSSLSSSGTGGTRMDMYGLRRIRGPDGQPLIEAQFFLWGVSPKTPVSFQELVLEYWEETPPSARVQQRRRRAGKNPKAPIWKPLGGARGTALPVVFVQDPSTRIAQFPSYVALGTLWFPQVPRTAKVMDLAYTYTVRKHGETFRSTLQWKKQPISGAWRLSEDEPWMADDVEVFEEDMKGVDPSR